MKYTATSILLLSATLILSACASTYPYKQSPKSTPAVNRTKTAPKSVAKVSQNVAYVNGQPISQSSLLKSMYELAGGEALANAVIDASITEDLALRKINITPEMMQAEKQLIIDALSPSSEDEAVRLLSQLRLDRGLGEYNFNKMLHRNAALRAIIAAKVNLNPQLLQQEYELRFGPKYQPRIIVMPNLRDIKRIHSQLDKGESFSDLAGANSTDISNRQGGLLSPISPVDANYPQVILQELIKLQPGQISQAIVLDNSYALLKLERIIPQSELQYDQVKDQIAKSLRLRIQATLMRQKASEYIASSQVTVLQPELHDSWLRKKNEYTDAPSGQ
ncbi:peptidylprolyl isomerase [Poriferisphaera corsica]|uniref:peptidylprolyl isomerase n=1 Tax=Poriferisphaera corsica TaxID=2528020 RepID=A0A517YUS2_9BACT|nr:peptidyl-prolyl cis-trans isomerase [Poriferisphaera corsica]QDU33967.1 peptidylprolyl isomerase [Poriferisphaera corsica]